MAALTLRGLSNIPHLITFSGVRSIWAASRLQHLSSNASGDTTSHTGTGTSSHKSEQRDGAGAQNGSTAGRSFHAEDDYDRDVARRILAASLPFVNKSGWTKTAISEGAEKLGYAGVVHGMFPHGGVELVNYFYTDCNERLVERLKEEYETRTKEEKKVEPEAIVKGAVEARLRMIVPYIDRWSDALVLLALPHNVPTSISNLLTLVDDICFYAGDRSVDVRWYTRRIGLATVYKMTELYFIQDKSEDHKATWDFLHQRVDEAVQLQGILHESGITPKIALETIAGTFDTARSILRLQR